MFKEGKDRILQKLGEEAIETIIAGMKNDRNDFIYESADLLFHLMVAFVEENIELKDVIQELIRRHKG